MAKTTKRKARADEKLMHIETDPQHHLTGPLMPQTPFGFESPSTSSPISRVSSPLAKIRLPKPSGLWHDLKTLRWVIEPASSFKLLSIPIVLYVQWEILTPYVNTALTNPFEPLIFISGYIPSSPKNDPRYAKTYLDLVFILYYIIVFSFFRQTVTVTIAKPIARYFGIKKATKLDRFGEQAYAVVYFALSGFWGATIMAQLPTWWYKTDAFWIDYPHWDMIPQLKRYYLMQSAYWCQQLLVLVLGLEKPRKDYFELVLHHIVTLWLIGWSYLINLTFIGNAVYVSMDIPDAFLAFSKLMNYLQFENTKNVSFAIFVCVWTYFRHWLNLVILHSVWTEFDLIPTWARQWNPPTGAWLEPAFPWMKQQIFGPILALQFLNIFWYFLILRILYRAFTPAGVDDVRSDDEDDGEDEVDNEPKKQK